MASQTTAEATSNIGTITWTEIPAIDLTRIQAFYSTVFGWTFTPFPPPEAGCEPNFILFNHGSTHGGFAKLSPENHLSAAKHPDNKEKERRSVTVTIAVESVDESMKLIEKAGGKEYHPKREIPGDMGFVAYFTDTEENVMGIWSQK